MMQFVVQHVPGQRQELLAELVNRLPHVIVIDCEGKPLETFERSLIRAGHWHLEDDAILAPDFLPRVTALVKRYGHRVIRGFSLSEPRHGWAAPSTYNSMVAVWIPQGYGPEIAGYLRRWSKREEHPTGFDTVLREWLVRRKEKYWWESPCVVQHAESKSLIGPRSSKRKSPSYHRHYGAVNGDQAKK